MPKIDESRGDYLGGIVFSDKFDALPTQVAQRLSVGGKREYAIYGFLLATRHNINYRAQRRLADKAIKIFFATRHGNLTRSHGEQSIGSRGVGIELIKNDVGTSEPFNILIVGEIFNKVKAEIGGVGCNYLAAYRFENVSAFFGYTILMPTQK